MDLGFTPMKDSIQSVCPFLLQSLFWTHWLFWGLPGISEVAHMDHRNPKEPRHVVYTDPSIGLTADKVAAALVAWLS